MNVAPRRGRGWRTSLGRLECFALAMDQGKDYDEPSSADRSPDDAALIRQLIDELFHCLEAGDSGRVLELQRQLRDVIGRRTPTHSTLRPIRG